MTIGAPRRIAVIGFGPKGLFALDRLAREAAGGAADFEVAVFEPHPVIGAGPIYDPRQPRFLRMNFASKHVDVGDPDPDSPGHLPSFLDWAAEHDPEVADPEGYAPRASVGAYLHAAAREVLARLREYAPTTLHPREATRVQRLDHRWLVEGSDGRQVCVDELLIATGHGSREPNLARRPDADSSVYPVARELAADRIPPRSAVAIRGMGLTALDALIALHRRRPEARPERVLMFSRTGRPMLPKLAPEAQSPEVRQILAPARDRLAAAPSVRELARALVEGASDLLAVEGRHRHAAASVFHVLMSGARRSGRRPLPQTALRRSIAIARGSRCWNAERALGEAWRALYPTVVAWHAAHPFARRERSTFRRLCRELERLAFGPPVEVAEEFMRSVDEGWVDLAVAVDPTLEATASGWSLRSRGHHRHADRLVDAVLPGPGIGSHPSPLFASLREAGHVRLRDGWTGVEVDADATAIGSDGTPTPGLAVIGRPTEGSVLGNDTLDRRLHPHPARWASRVVAPAASRALQLS